VSSYSDRLAEGFTLLNDDQALDPDIVEDYLIENRIVRQDRLPEKIWSPAVQKLRDDPPDYTQEIIDDNLRKKQRSDDLKALNAMIIGPRTDDPIPWGIAITNDNGVISIGIRKRPRLAPIS